MVNDTMKNAINAQYIAEELSQLRDLLIVIERGGTTSPDILYKLAVEKSRKVTMLIEQWSDVVVPPRVELPAGYETWEDELLPAEDTTPELVEDVADESMQEPVRDVVAEEGLVEPEQAEAQEDLDPLPFDCEDDVQEACVESVADEGCADDDCDVVPAEVVMSQEEFEPTCEEPEVVAETIDVIQYFDDSPEVDVEDEAIEAEDTPVMVVDDSPEVAIMDMEVTIADDEVGEYVVADDADEHTDEEDVAAFVEDEIEEVELYNRGEPMENEPLTVGDVLSVHRAKELRKALSLNDRFRFRRELFGNSDVNMNDTLNLIDTMDDYAEAREYITHDLGWSIGEPVVKEFLELIDRHFKQK